MYPIRRLLKNSFFLLITVTFAFVLTFSHVLIYGSLEDDILKLNNIIETTKVLEKKAEFGQGEPAQSYDTFSKATKVPMQPEKDDAPEHLNTIFFTDFLSYYTYSLKIHIKDIKNHDFYIKHTIYSDSFFVDVIKPPIFA